MVMNSSLSRASNIHILNLEYIYTADSAAKVDGGYVQTYAYSWGTGTSTFGEAFALATGPITRTKTFVNSNVATYGSISVGYGSANAFASSSSLSGFQKSSSFSTSNSLSFSSISSF